MRLIGDSHSQALGARLQALPPGLVVVANPGWTLERSLNAGLVKGSPGEVVILEFGTNEVFNGLLWDAYLAQLKRAAAVLAGCRVVLVGPPALDHGWLGETASQWDDLAAEAAQSLGWAYISSLEVTHGAWRYNGPGDSGIHQTPAGYDAWAAHIAQALAALPAEKASITPALLLAVCPALPRSRAEALAQHLQAAADEFGIDTPVRVAAFVAQCAQETDGFNTLEEYASGAAYEGRADLGNTQPGDGRRFKGRGAIQLTGRANYASASRALGVDLVNHPELATEPALGCRIAGWYWSQHGLNALADLGTHAAFVEITHKVNGWENGLSTRLTMWARVKVALGINDAAPLRLGSAGALVQQLQRALAVEGHNPGRADGVFGSGTDTMVRAFQGGRGLAADGIAGPKTLAALGLS